MLTRPRQPRSSTGVRPVARDLSHILTETLGGPGGQGPVEVEHIKLVHDDQVLLCTDGLSDAVDEDQIADLLALRRSADEQCRLLVDAALRAGGQDNVTVLLAQYEIPVA